MGCLLLHSAHVQHFEELYEYTSDKQSSTLCKCAVMCRQWSRTGYWHSSSTHLLCFGTEW